MTEYSTETVWVGMDVHQDSITAAILFGNDTKPQVERLPGDLNAVRRMFRRLSQYGAPRSCYEASGAGWNRPNIAAVMCSAEARSPRMGQASYAGS